MEAKHALAKKKGVTGNTIRSIAYMSKKCRCGQRLVCGQIVFESGTQILYHLCCHEDCREEAESFEVGEEYVANFCPGCCRRL